MDTSVLVKAERTGAGAFDFAIDLRRVAGRESLGLSVISLLELAQGQAQAGSEGRVQLRAAFLKELRGAFPIHGITEQIAIRAGLVNGTLQANGFTIGVADVLIAATALEIGFGVLTHNRKHFDYVPDLHVVAAQS